MNLEQKLKKYRLSSSEYENICSLLKREPRGVEWGLFSALWSEHCSYKSSKIHLKKFYNKNNSVLVSEGENSGVVDLGLGEKISFKMESHNHPSFIEPYQGAATGVGGILRDIFTMGARPIALANFLCFGDMESPRMKGLVEGVVGGISGYGNCVGVPNISGFTEFHSSYNKNILVNAFALGVLYPGEELALSKAKGVGNFVVYVGAKTGRDGIHGASMASESFDDKSSQNRPTVQIGDPFFEKLLIESCLEVIRKKLVVAIQDMGAAGLISSSFEMASKGGVGLELHLDQVPLRDSSLEPEDILLSESQERMLLICEPNKLKEIIDIFSKYDLEAKKIGEVLPTKNMKLHWRGELLTEIDPDLLVENAPKYNRYFSSHKKTNRKKIHSLEIFNISETLKDILKSSQGCSKNYIYQQYDQRVGAQTASDCSNSIGVVRLESSKRGLGIALGCRPHFMRLDTRVGALDSVFFPALQLAIKGFKPLALTDCLNFGNPEEKEVMSDFVTSVESISEACRELDSPVISGNVSFYNQTLGKNITPTPATGLVGIRENVQGLTADYFLNEMRTIYLVYDHQLESLGRLAELYLNQNSASDTELSVGNTAEFIKKIKDISSHPSIESSKVVGQFGLLYTLFKMSETKNIGFSVEENTILKSPSDLFNERLYECVFTVSETKDFEKKLNDLGLSFSKIGITLGKNISVMNEKINLEELKSIYKNSLEDNLRA